MESLCGKSWGWPLPERDMPTFDREPLPQPAVAYTPETQTLVVDTGKPSEVGAEIANDLVVFYDTANNAVSFTLESAEFLLKPLVDAVLVKYRGESNPSLRRSVGGQDCFAKDGQQIRRETPANPIATAFGLEPLPDLIAEYCPDTETLILDTGARWSAGTEIARGLTVFYDADHAAEPDNNAAAFRIESAERLLKPLVDSALSKYRGETGSAAIARDFVAGDGISQSL